MGLSLLSLSVLPRSSMQSSVSHTVIDSIQSVSASPFYKARFDELYDDYNDEEEADIDSDDQDADDYDAVDRYEPDEWSDDAESNDAESVDDIDLELPESNSADDYLSSDSLDSAARDRSDRFFSDSTRAFVTGNSNQHSKHRRRPTSEASVLANDGQYTDRSPPPQDDDSASDPQNFAQQQSQSQFDPNSPDAPDVNQPSVEPKHKYNNIVARFYRGFVHKPLSALGHGVAAAGRVAYTAGKDRVVRPAWGVTRKGVNLGYEGGKQVLSDGTSVGEFATRSGYHGVRRGVGGSVNATGGLLHRGGQGLAKMFRNSVFGAKRVAKDVVAGVASPIRHTISGTRSVFNRSFTHLKHIPGRMNPNRKDSDDVQSDQDAEQPMSTDDQAYLQGQDQQAYDPNSPASAPAAGAGAGAGGADDYDDDPQSAPARPPAYSAQSTAQVQPQARYAQRQLPAYAPAPTANYQRS